MPLILRSIRQSRWYKIERLPWLAQGDMQADPLGDLTTTNNELSVWVIADDKANLNRIIAAVAATRDQVQNLDYLLVNQHLLTDINIKSKKVKGTTPDEKANSWHLNLIELSALKLVELGKVMLAQGEVRRTSHKDVGQLIADSVNNGHIERAKLKVGIQAKIKNQWC